MAPEVLFGKNHTYGVDFYALGIMGYEFIFGDRPYEGTSRHELREEIIKKQARIHFNEIPKGWSKEGVDFINKLMQRKPEKRLGNTNGVKELKEHKWFKNFNWEALLNKTMDSPFIPPDIDNYDKEYCEEESEINLSTNERYDAYLHDKKFSKIFVGYTFINEETEKEIIKKYEEMKNMEKMYKKEKKLILSPLYQSNGKKEEISDKKIFFSNPNTKEEHQMLDRNFRGKNDNFSNKLNTFLSKNNSAILSENLKHKNKNYIDMNSLIKVNLTERIKNMKKINNQNNNNQSQKLNKFKMNASQSMKNIFPNGFMTQRRKFNIDDIKSSHKKNENLKKVYLNKPLNLPNNFFSPKNNGNFPKLRVNPNFFVGNQTKYITNSKNNCNPNKNIIRVNSPINLNIFHLNMLNSNNHLMHSQSTRNISMNHRSKNLYGY